jgi:hypothetical protein
LTGVKPFVGQSGHKVFIVVVRLETIEGKEVWPGGWGFLGASMHSFKEIVIDDVELRTDMVGPKISN